MTATHLPRPGDLPELITSEPQAGRHGPARRPAFDRATTEVPIIAPSGRDNGPASAPLPPPSRPQSLMNPQPEPAHPRLAGAPFGPDAARLGADVPHPGPDSTRLGPDVPHPGPDSTRLGPDVARPTVASARSVVEPSWPSLDDTGVLPHRFRPDNRGRDNAGPFGAPPIPSGPAPTGAGTPAPSGTPRDGTATGGPHPTGPDGPDPDGTDPDPTGTDPNGTAQGPGDPAAEHAVAREPVTPRGPDPDDAVPHPVDAPSTASPAEAFSGTAPAETFTLDRTTEPDPSPPPGGTADGPPETGTGPTGPDPTGSDVPAATAAGAPAPGEAEEAPRGRADEPAEGHADQSTGAANGGSAATRADARPPAGETTTAAETTAAGEMTTVDAKPSAGETPRAGETTRSRTGRPARDRIGEPAGTSNATSTGGPATGGLAAAVSAEYSGWKTAATGRPATNGASVASGDVPAPASTGRGPGDVPETADGKVWADEAARSFRDRWQGVAARFIDEPEAALTEAEELVTDAVRRLSEQLDLDPRKRVERPDTETMRMAMRRYREFLNRVLEL